MRLTTLDQLLKSPKGTLYFLPTNDADGSMARPEITDLRVFQHRETEDGLRFQYLRLQNPDESMAMDRSVPLGLAEVRDVAVPQDGLVVILEAQDVTRVIDQLRLCERVALLNADPGYLLNILYQGGDPTRDTMGLLISWVEAHFSTQALEPVDALLEQMDLTRMDPNWAISALRSTCRAKEYLTQWCVTRDRVARHFQDSPEILKRMRGLQSDTHEPLGAIPGMAYFPSKSKTEIPNG